MVVHTAEKDQINYFAQHLLGKIAFIYVPSAALLSCCCHKLLFSPFRELQGLELYYNMPDPRIR